MATRPQAGERVASGTLEAGRDALARGAWPEARTAYEAALREQESPAALEGLSWAAWWQADADTVFAARRRAYHLYRRAGDNRGAARMAMWLGTDHVDFRGELAVGNGWLQRARRLLEGENECVEYGWLCVHEAEKALYVEDTVTALSLAGIAVELGRRLDDVTLEMLGRATEGLSMVTEGAVADGMRPLDEAVAAGLAGELRQVWAASWCCCYVIYACERAHDYERAAEWCRHAIDYAERNSIESFNRLCRAHYAGVLLWRGTWPEAERELVVAEEKLSATRPPWALEAIVRLGELRRRQGRLTEAGELFDQAPDHPLALLGRAELALDRGDADAAADLLEWLLGETPERSRTQRATVLDVMVRARLSQGDLPAAADALGELRAIAEFVGGDALAAIASFAAGAFHAAEGDPNAARRAHEDAVLRFTRAGAPFETGRARLELAKALAALGRAEHASKEAASAASVFRRLGATAEAERAERWLAARGGSPRSSPITRREREVLELVAAGKSDRLIAEQLVLSEHTVHRHVANILAKLNCSSRSAAVAEALRRGLL